MRKQCVPGASLFCARAGNEATINCVQVCSVVQEAVAYPDPCLPGQLASHLCERLRDVCVEIDLILLQRKWQFLICSDVVW